MEPLFWSLPSTPARYLSLFYTLLPPYRSSCAGSVPQLEITVPVRWSSPSSYHTLPLLPCPVRSSNSHGAPCYWPQDSKPDSIPAHTIYQESLLNSLPLIQIDYGIFFFRDSDTMVPLALPWFSLTRLWDKITKVMDCQIPIWRVSSDQRVMVWLVDWGRKVKGVSSRTEPREAGETGPPNWWWLGLDYWHGKPGVQVRTSRSSLLTCDLQGNLQITLIFGLLSVRIEFLEPSS